MAKQGQTRKGGKVKRKKKTSNKGVVRYSPPFEAKLGGGFKRQSRIRIKTSPNKRKEEIFYTGPETAGRRGAGRKGKVTTKITSTGKTVQKVRGKALNKRLKRNLGEKMIGAGKDKAAKLKRQHLFGKRRKQRTL